MKYIVYQIYFYFNCFTFTFVLCSLFTKVQLGSICLHIFNVKPHIHIHRTTESKETSVTTGKCETLLSTLCYDEKRLFSVFRNEKSLFSND